MISLIARTASGFMVWRISGLRFTISYMSAPLSQAAYRTSFRSFSYGLSSDTGLPVTMQTCLPAATASWIETRVASSIVLALVSSVPSKSNAIRRYSFSVPVEESVIIFPNGVVVWQNMIRYQCTQLQMKRQFLTSGAESSPPAPLPVTDSD